MTDLFVYNARAKKQTRKERKKINAQSTMTVISGRNIQNRALIQNDSKKKTDPEFFQSESPCLMMQRFICELSVNEQTLPRLGSYIFLFYKGCLGSATPATARIWTRLSCLSPLYGGTAQLGFCSAGRSCMNKRIGLLPHPGDRQKADGDSR